MTSAEHSGVPPSLLALARASAAPRLVEASLAHRFGPRSSWQPIPGQLWRAAQGKTNLLVLLVAVDARTAVAAPVTTDVTASGKDVLVIDGTSLALPVLVWAGLRRPIPIAALDRPIDELGADVLARVLQAPLGDLPPVLGSLAEDPLDARAELLDALEDLIDATMAELPSPVDPAPAGAASSPGIDLDAVDATALEVARERLGVTFPVLLDIIDGKRPPTPAQAAVLLEVLGAAPTPAEPPSGLVLELLQPRWRGVVRAHGRHDIIDERAARSDLAHQVLAMAARQTGLAEPAWPDRIRRWAEAHRIDPDVDA